MSPSSLSVFSCGALTNLARRELIISANAEHKKAIEGARRDRLQATNNTTEVCRQTLDRVDQSTGDVLFAIRQGILNMTSPARVHESLRKEDATQVYQLVLRRLNYQGM